MDLSTVDHLLTTTRSVRKRLDFSRPVEPEVIERCIEIALQSPTGSNQQAWQWVVVTDAAKRKAIADAYRKTFEAYAAVSIEESVKRFRDDDLRREQAPRIRDSATWLAEHMHEAPVFVIPCIWGRFENAGPVVQASQYGSILPAVWSFMLALRARGLGTAWTTLHLVREKEVSEILGIPGEKVTQTALLPVAYFTGDDFKPAKRLPAREITHWNAWGTRR
jgi:nitroreductase